MTAWLRRSRGLTPGFHAVGEWTDSVHPLHSQAPTDPWDTLDELAFAGEAIFEYLTLPYLLAEPDAVVDATMRR